MSLEIALCKGYSASTFKNACLQEKCPQAGALLELTMCNGYKEQVVFSRLFDREQPIPFRDLVNKMGLRVVVALIDEQDFAPLDLVGQAGSSARVYIVDPPPTCGHYPGYGIVNTVTMVAENSLEYFRREKVEITTGLQFQGVCLDSIDLIQQYIFNPVILRAMKV